MMESSILKSLPLGRYGTNVLLAVSCVLVLILLYSTQLSGIRTSINLGEREIECELPKDKVLVDLNQIIRSPVSLAQDDPKFIQKLREEWINPPSKEPYNLKGDKDDPSMGQSEKIREILQNKRDGFFIECGALDGETRSNSLGFEKLYGWSGVIIEGDPKNFKLVQEKHRKAYSVGACLSTMPYPNTVLFQQSFNLGKISKLDPSNEGKHSGYAEVQCLPIYSILLALNRTQVDYFSLDVEGHELEVLKTIPWDKVNITTLSVEFAHGKESKAAQRAYMESKGYHMYAEVTNPHGYANDFIFVRKDYLAKQKSKS